jgi:PPP family 3-phenylpropionic acid transporter
MVISKTLRVQNCYFWFYAFVGIWGGLLGPYLHGLKFSGVQIAFITAAAPVCSAIFPSLWGMISDRIGDTTRPLQLALTTAAILLLPFPWLKTFAIMLPIYFAFCVFRAGNGALIDSISLTVIDEEGGDFGRSRLFGSLGFLIMGLGAALLADTFTDSVIPWALVVMQAMAALASYALPRARRPATSNYLKDMRTLLRTRGFKLFLFTGLLMQMACAASIIFYPVHMKETGATNLMVAGFWCIGVAFEALLLMKAAWVIKRFGWGLIYLLATSTVVLRFAPLFALDNLVVVLGLQTMHALTFGGFYYVSVHFAQACAPETLRSSAQTLFVSICFGLASGIGILVSGPLFDHYGIDGVLTFTLIVGTIALLLAIPTAREIQRKLGST